jgi:8-oxo-dGTP pyrophosphatase MutT (NUDIX family)
MMRTPTLVDVQQALALMPFDVAAAHGKMAPMVRANVRPLEMPGTPRVGSVLLLLYCREDQLHLVLTKRRADLNAHAGQVSFPGGRQEPWESLTEAALRETEEEIGVPPTGVALLGRLATVYILPSDYEVHPFVGWYGSGEPAFVAAEREVEQILQTPLAHLLDPMAVREGPVQGRGFMLTVPYFDVQGHVVWGATAVMLSEFVERLRMVMRNA